MTAKAQNVCSENVQKHEKLYSRHIHLRNKNRSYLYVDILTFEINFLNICLNNKAEHLRI